MSILSGFNFSKALPVLRKGGLAGALCALGLSGCSMLDAKVPMALFDDCMSNLADVVEDAEWNNVINSRVRIIDDNFRPMVMYLEKGRPYSLTLENVDMWDHSLWSPSLLKYGLALESVQIGDQEPAKGCVNGVRIAQGKQVTLRFVPVREGRYEAFDSGLPIPGQLADAVFHVVPPRLGYPAE